MAGVSETTDVASPVRFDLVEAVRELAGARTVDDVTAVVRSAARDVSGADGATFVLRDGDECHYVDEDAVSPLWKGKRFPMSACISGWAMNHRTSVVIEDIYLDDRIPQDAYRPTFVRSLVMVPIRTSDPVGAIGCYWSTVRQPSEDEVRVLQALADSTAVAMENVRLYRDLESRVAARTQELSALNEDLRAFTAALAHDVRQPLTTIKGYADLLSEYHSSQLDADGRASVDALRRSSDNLTQFIADLLVYLTSGSAEVERARIDLGELVATVTERLEHDITARGARVTCEGEEHLDADPTLLSQLLQNLLGNALVHMPDQRAPEVRVSLHRVSSGWELAVIDNGDGVAHDEQELIFEALQRGSTSSARHGTGLGLATCRRVAERHGGTIRVERATPHGAAFVVTLPANDHAPEAAS